MMACAAHPAVESYLSCGRCERAICARCLVHTPVGSRCGDCAGSDRGPRVRVGAGDSAPKAALRGIDGWVESNGYFVFAVLAVLAGAFLLRTWLLGDRDGLIVKVVVYGGWLVSLVLHEFSHSLIAYLGGDTDIKRRGYLTLNPFRFMDPVFSVIVPMLFVLMGGIGLIGGRTLVDEHALRSRWWSSAVSIAGPATNLVLAALLGGLLQTGLIDVYSPLGSGLACLAVLQVSAMLFNLIPFPSLDGFGALAPFLPEELVHHLRVIGRLGCMVPALVFWSVPGLAGQFWSEVYLLAERLQIPVYASYAGFESLRLFQY
jgi:Zn-dependent protease